MVTDMITLYGAEGSGSIPVEATLTLLGIPYELIEGATWANKAARTRVASANPMMQVPTLVLPTGEIITESAAILIGLADLHPQAKLAPGPTDPGRAQYLRWMIYVSAAIYSWFWLRANPSRLGVEKAKHAEFVERIHQRIADCWRMMDQQITPGRYILGDDLSVLDIYVTVISRFAPRRKRFYEAAPRMAQIVPRVDDDPRLRDFWARRFPFPRRPG